MIKLEEVIPFSVLPRAIPHTIAAKQKETLGEIFMVQKWVHTGALSMTKAVSVACRLLLSLKVLDVGYFLVHNGAFFCYEVWHGCQLVGFSNTISLALLPKSKTS